MYLFIRFYQAVALEAPFGGEHEIKGVTYAAPTAEKLARWWHRFDLELGMPDPSFFSLRNVNESRLGWASKPIVCTPGMLTIFP
ncbi:hypothetical protein ABIE63_002765 [Limibacillus sp. MBR-115]|jgi:hypothetical protein